MGFYGIFQPFRDAIKLFSKENIKVIKLNFFIYYISPLFGIFLCLLIWLVFPVQFSLRRIGFGLIFFFCISSLMVYFLLGRGWSSSSKYSSIGSYRAAAQAISYEVRMILILLGICWIVRGYNFLYWNFTQFSLWFSYMCFPLFISWLIACLAERNRSPFDFSEGESELVSGFNTEYGGGLFRIIFITEYGSILFLGIFTSFFFLGGGLFSRVKAFLVAAFYVWVRGSFPRLRYDKLIIIAWKGMLPFVLGAIFFIFLLGGIF